MCRANTIFLRQVTRFGGQPTKKRPLNEDFLQNMSLNRSFISVRRSLSSSQQNLGCDDMLCIVPSARITSVISVALSVSESLSAADSQLQLCSRSPIVGVGRSRALDLIQQTFATVASNTRRSGDAMRRMAGQGDRVWCAPSDWGDNVGEGDHRQSRNTWLKREQPDCRSPHSNGTRSELEWLIRPLE